MSFETGKSYRVKADCYDKFQFDCPYWKDKTKNHVFCVDGSLIKFEDSGLLMQQCPRYCIAVENEFYYCEEVVSSVKLNLPITELDDRAMTIFELLIKNEHISSNCHLPELMETAYALSEQSYRILGEIIKKQGE